MKRLPFALLALGVSGCADLPPLSDATVVDVRRATADDIARYESAGYLLSPSSSTVGGWPVVRVAFRSTRDLYSGGSPVAAFCSAMRANSWWTGQWEVMLMWHDRPIEQVRLELEAAQWALPDQEYEFFFRYGHWGFKYTQENGERINLLPLLDDLCIAFWDYNLPFRERGSVSPCGSIKM